MRQALTAFPVVVRLDGQTRDVNVDLPEDCTNEGLKEIVASEMNISNSLLNDLRVDWTEDGAVIRPEAPWG